jgi:hypothetical protein
VNFRNCVLGESYPHRLDFCGLNATGHKKYAVSLTPLKQCCNVKICMIKKKKSLQRFSAFRNAIQCTLYLGRYHLSQLTLIFVHFRSTFIFCQFIFQGSRRKRKVPCNQPIDKKLPPLFSDSVFTFERRWLLG